MAIAIATTVAAATVTPRHTQAAGSAYAVDTSEVSDGGSCKVESWLSVASNSDAFAAVNPSCAFALLRPVELSAQFARSRADDEWATAVTPKAKMNLLPSGIGTFGLAVSSTASFDLMTRQNTSVAFTVPATMRLSENMRINLNAGWLLDRAADRHYLTYGVGFDWRTPDNVFTLTTEVFGQAGASETPSVVQPRFQAGLRYRPIDRFSVDLIYGRNITGEDAHWITLATVIRFPAPGK
jgi:hypothetical protein